MRISLALVALAGTLAAAFPAYGSEPATSTLPSQATPPPKESASPLPSDSNTGVDIPDTRNDGAATIYKATHFKGKSSPTDYTALPTEIDCLDLSSLYGVWENKTRSLVVQEGYKCDFYTKPQCEDTPLCVIAQDGKVEKETLPKEFDRKIVSVKCGKWEAAELEPKPETPTYGEY